MLTLDTNPLVPLLVRQETTYFLVRDEVGIVPPCILSLTQVFFKPNYNRKLLPEVGVNVESMTMS